MGTSLSERGLGLLPPLAAAVPLACSSGFGDHYLIPNAAAAALALLFGAGVLLWSGDWDAPMSGIDAPVAAFLLAAALCSAFSMDFRMSLFGRYPDVLFGLPGLAACAAAFWLACSLSRAGLGGRLRFWMVLFSIPVSLYAVMQSCGIEPLFPGIVLPAGARAASTLGSPVFLGTYLAMIVPLSLGLRAEHPKSAGSARPNLPNTLGLDVLNLRRVEGSIRPEPTPSGCSGRTGHPTERTLGTAALALALAALALTGTRSAWLGAAAGTGLWGFLRLRSRPGPIPKRPLLLAGAALILLWSTLSIRRDQLSKADSERFSMWKIAGAQFLRTPWLGSGPDTFILPFCRLRAEPFAGLARRGWTQDQAHNDLLQVLATMGLAGILAYGWLHCAAARAALSAIRSKAPGAMEAAAALFAVWVAAKFNALSLSAVWPACWVAGTLLAPPDAPPRRPARRVLMTALLMVCVGASSFLALRAAAAERFSRLGSLARRSGAMRDGAAHLERALSLRPEVLPYRFNLNQLLWDAAEGSPRPSKALVYDRAVQVALGGIRSHPLHPEAYRLLGLSELKRIHEGRKDRIPAARMAFETAQALDPGDPWIEAPLEELSNPWRRN